MSIDGLPPRWSSLQDKINAVIRREGFASTRQFAKALGAEPSVVGKWINGPTKTIKAPHHLEALPKVTNTPSDYWLDWSHEAAAAKEAQVAELRAEWAAFLETQAARWAAFREEIREEIRNNFADLLTRALRGRDPDDPLPGKTRV